MKLFYRDRATKRSINWEQFIEDINNTQSVPKYCYAQDYYTIFKNIILAFVSGNSITILDSDFSDDEIKQLVGEEEFAQLQSEIPINRNLDFTNAEEVIASLNKNSRNSKLYLFTSGTTGLPKKVSHSFTSLTRFAKISIDRRNDVWGFAYNPTHIAGIQVFLQAFLNQNSIIRLFGFDNTSIETEILDFQVTNISATPTFFRLILPLTKSCTSVTNITTGGEKFDNKIIQQLKKAFPNGRFRNVYASTEAGTVLAAEGDLFSIKPEFENLVKIADNELLLHKSLMGGFENEDEWYRTNDIVTIVNKNPIEFKFVARKNEMINVGGYKVNPHEVEESVRMHPDIINARVFVKRNSILGNIIGCEIVASNEELTEVAIRSYLQSLLQEFKIPRIFKFVSKIEVNRTGKVNRK